MNKNLTSILFLFALLTMAAIATASSSSTFDEIMQPYEWIRLRLLNDSTEGIVEHAESLRKTASAAAEASAADEEVRPLLKKISGFAKELAAAEDIEASRQAFYEISKMLVQFRSKLSGDDLPSVMYCPMARRSWLQLDDEIGNPYHGQSMAACGNVVGEE